MNTNKLKITPDYEMGNKQIKHMKRLILILIISLLFFGCIDQNQTFTGYLVAKEYTPEHMSNESEKTVSYATIVPYVTHVNPPPPHKVDAKWVWYIANKNEIICKAVNKDVFDTKKCGEKITVKRY